MWERAHTHITRTWHSYRCTTKPNIYWIFIVAKPFFRFAFPFVSHISNVTFCLAPTFVGKNANTVFRTTTVATTTRQLVHWPVYLGPAGASVSYYSSLCQFFCCCHCRCRRGKCIKEPRFFRRLSLRSTSKRKNVIHVHVAFVWKCIVKFIIK